MTNFEDNLIDAIDVLYEHECPEHLLDDVKAYATAYSRWCIEHLAKKLDAAGQTTAAEFLRSKAEGVTK